jgi:tight adherence protein B
MNEPWLVYFVIFGAVFLTVQFGYLFLSRDVGTRLKVNQRLASIESGRYQPYKALSLRRSARFNNGLPTPLKFIEKILIQAGGQQATLPVMSAAMGSFAVAGVLMWLSTQSYAKSFSGAAVVATASTIVCLLVVRARRIRAFSEQLPELIEIIVRSLHAGHPLTTSLTLVAREMPDPAGTEIGLTSDEIAYGREIGSALDNMCERVGYEELRYFSTSITIQHQTGGNLAEILTRLANLLRDRFRMKRKVRALSSEGRLSAVALSVFPFLLFAIINLLSPAYYGDVWHHPAFELAMYLCAALLLIGNIILYRMVNFRI